MTEPPEKSSWGRVVVINIIVLTLMLLVLELSARALGYFGKQPTGEFELVNFALRGAGYHPWQPDAELGYGARPGHHQLWGRPVTILPSGLRSNGPKSLPHDGPSILAVGDSFTWGDEVGDTDTWPAQLEQTLGVPVLNAGVFGYGIGQIVLHAERTTEAMKRPPLLRVMMLIPDDIVRTIFNVRSGVPKPMFSLEDGELLVHPPDKKNLENAPEMSPAFDLFRHIGGYSFLIHHVMLRLTPIRWRSSQFYGRVWDVDPGPVSCALVQRFAAAPSPALLIVNHSEEALVRGHPSKEIVSLIECVKQSVPGLEVIDMWEALAAREASGQLEALYEVTHMSRAGYALVVEELMKSEAVRAARTRAGVTEPAR